MPKALITGQSATSMLANEHARVSARALHLYGQVSGALAGAPAANSTLFPAGNPLADQRKMVARMIAVSQDPCAKRQVFFVSLGGFDMDESLGMSAGSMTAVLRNVGNYNPSTWNLGFV